MVGTLCQICVVCTPETTMSSNGCYVTMLKVDI